jgi:hypothetical protein
VSREKQLVQAQMRCSAQIERTSCSTRWPISRAHRRAPDKASVLMDNFIAYVRESLSASRAQDGSVQQEFALLRHYLDLIKIRMADRLQYTLSLAPGLESVPMAPMLLQPLVENAIKHGLEPKVEGGTVSVDVRRAGDAGNERMLITVEDNGLSSPMTPTARAPGGARQPARAAGRALRRASDPRHRRCPSRHTDPDCRAAAPETNSLTTGTRP